MATATAVRKSVSFANFHRKGDDGKFQLFVYKTVLTEKNCGFSLFLMEMLKLKESRSSVTNINVRFASFICWIFYVKYLLFSEKLLPLGNKFF